jgi:hypothetical protein
MVGSVPVQAQHKRLLAVALASCMAGFSAHPMHAQPAPAQPGSQAAKDGKETHLTKEQGEELFRSVDEILGFVSTDTKLPIVHSVKRKLISRDEVNKFLRAKFDEDEGAKRLERSEIVLKKFGLLDRDFHLRPFLITLLTEQVAGFYDNKTKTVNLLDWIDLDEQKPVLAHELTHALQDQRVDLSKWSQVSATDIARNTQEENRHLLVDEGDTARDAVAEGQAMVTFIDYSLKPSGKTLADSPEIADRLKDAVTDSSRSPVLARAPLLLQQSLMFPYSEGLSFEEAILLKNGVEPAFGGVLAAPPTSSFEILHPDAYLAHTPVPVLRLPNIHPLIDADYAPYDVGVMGEFDVRMLIELFGGREIADALSPEWDGGIYYAAQRKSATTPAAKESTASLGLVYYSRWKNEDSARSFLRIYAGQLARKYSGLARRTKDEADATEQVYTTREGDVLLSLNDNGVFISEGFPLALARKLGTSIAGVQSDGPMKIAATPETEGASPCMSLVKLLSSAGLVRAAIPEDSPAGRYTFLKP